MSLHKYVVFYQEIDDEGDAREDCLEVYAYIAGNKPFILQPNISKKTV